MIVGGDPVRRAGFFTRAVGLRSKSQDDLERSLGFKAGRLAHGWWLGFMTELPGQDDFEFAGYSHLSGGVEQGHLASPPDPRSMHRRLIDERRDVVRLKASAIASFTLEGAQRLAKVFPVAKPSGVEDDYPPGTGLPQWKLLPGHEKPFAIVAFIRPGDRYLGDFT